MDLRLFCIVQFLMWWIEGLLLCLKMFLRAPALVLKNQTQKLCYLVSLYRIQLAFNENVPSRINKM
jgi:hypothetical protein